MCIRDSKRAAHLLTRYPELMPGNPRLIRRVVNAWGMLTALKDHVGHQHDADTGADAGGGTGAMRGYWRP